MVPATDTRPGHLAPRALTPGAADTLPTWGATPRQKTAPGASNHKEEPTMTDEQQQPAIDPEERKIKRAIVLQVLRDDHPERWTRAELERQLSDLPPEGVEAAIEDLAAEGVLIDDDGTVRASLCARTLDALELVTI